MLMVINYFIILKTQPKQVHIQNNTLVLICCSSREINCNVSAAIFVFLEIQLYNIYGKFLECSLKS